MSSRLDATLVALGKAVSRSQAENYVRMGFVKVNGQVVIKAGHQVKPEDKVEFTPKEQYVSRAGYKLASVVQLLKVDFTDETVLDVGSSTGGFTDYALQHGAKKVIAVDVGTQQLHPSLRNDARIELHEKTDIRDFRTTAKIDVVVIDVSFISLAEILPSVHRLSHKNTEVIAMVKPQFEARVSGLKHKGVIKNDAMRRQILRDFETWVKNQFTILDKADSEVSGSKGNLERFYKLKPIY